MDSRLNIDAATEEKLSRIVLVNQMIVGGLIAGVLFLTIMLVVMQQSGAVEQEPKEDSLPIVALAAAGVAAMATIARVFVGMMGTVKDDGQQPSATSPVNGLGSDIEDPFIRRVAGNWTVGNIVRNAITEGAALFNGIAYMVEGQIWSIAIVGALIAWMLFGMPTKTSLKQRIEERQMDLPPEPNL